MPILGDPVADSRGERQIKGRNLCEPGAIDSLQVGLEQPLGGYL